LVRESNIIFHYRPDRKNIKIGSGSKNATALEKRSVAHHKYFWLTLDYDAGVVKVAPPFVLDAAHKPIALVNAGEDPAAGEPVVVFGWGYNKARASIWKGRGYLNAHVAKRSDFIAI